MKTDILHIHTHVCTHTHTHICERVVHAHEREMGEEGGKKRKRDRATTALTERHKKFISDNQTSTSKLLYEITHKVWWQPHKWMMLLTFIEPMYNAIYIIRTCAFYSTPMHSHREGFNSKHTITEERRPLGEHGLIILQNTKASRAHSSEGGARHPTESLKREGVVGISQVLLNKLSLMVDLQFRGFLFCFVFVQYLCVHRS